ncbi:MAG TPA: lmo0937 family membrane protein [Anaeromyxobacter sp.]|nr:lmo0937 family membrane protein [Anaeromyxobacter sp.]
MLWTIAFVLLALWGLGLFTSTTLGGLIHLLLVASFVVMMVRVFKSPGRGRAGKDQSPAQARKAPGPAEKASAK